MIAQRTPATTELDDAVTPYLEQIAQIDRIITGPARTLIRVARDAASSLHSGPPKFPLWIMSDPLPDSRRNSLTTSLALVTLHRLHHMQRRFPELKENFKGLGKVLEKLRKGYLPSRRDLGDERYFDACADFVDSRTFGFLNPFTSAQVFRLLMESGEDHAHTGVGCIAFFAMVWPLFRRSPDPLDIGARIEPYRPTAYVTAKCLLPLIELRNICTQRADLFNAIGTNLQVLTHARDDAGASSLSHWTFCAEVDNLRHHLHEMAAISIDREAFSACDANLREPLERLGPRDPVLPLYHHVVRELARALRQVAGKSAELLGDADVILTRLRREVVAPLDDGRVPEVTGRSFKFYLPPAERPAHYRAYLKDLARAGHDAAELCGSVLHQLKRAADMDVPELPDEKTMGERSPEADVLEASVKKVAEALARMAEINREVARAVDGPTGLHIRWCRTVGNQEIALAAAGNDTDFNPPELVSALAVAVRNKDLLTESLVADAMDKAVRGANRDGSWRPGHPYFSSDGIQSLRPPAADVVWTLVSALAQFPAVRVADDTLFGFVDWLDRTRREITPASTTPPPTSTTPDFGWSADQTLERDRIELFTTSYAINALLAVRDVAEHRLWELCESRFTVVRTAIPLKEMAPVDLMVPHRHRLHNKLSAMVREAHRGAPDAVYSIVLHGPPGSSKTTVAGALSSEGRRLGRWGDHRRLVRVTPADFTRMGEDRVDAEAASIFRLLQHVRGVTILFDEIDDLLRRRGDNDPRFLDLVIPAMLNRLQDLRDACPRQEICFLFGTNYVERIEPALMRAGRIDRRIPVPYPDRVSRRGIAEREIRPVETRPTKYPGGKEWEQAWKTATLNASDLLATATSGWSWSGVRLVARALHADIERRISMAEANAAEEGEARPLMPDNVVAGWQGLVDAAVAANPLDIRTDTIYPKRFEKKTDSRELRTESLRHLLTYCTSDSGQALLEELRARIWPDTAVDDQLNPEGEALLRALGLLDGAAAPGGNGVSGGANVAGT